MTFTSLRSLRRQQGVTQAFVANKLGINRITYMQYELGRTHPPRSFFYQLAHIFHLPLEEVLPLADHVQSDS